LKRGRAGVVNWMLSKILLDYIVKALKGEDKM
jgi:hypothetical protein